MCVVLLPVDRPTRAGGAGSGASGERRKHCVDKDSADGLCVYFDREALGCTIWDRRPSVCREYDCNGDPLLQIVLRDGFHSLKALITARPVPSREHVSIPYVDPETRPRGDVRPAEPLVRLRRKLHEQRPSSAPDAGETEAALEMRRLRVAIAAAIGDARACASCARGAPLPAGRFEGGRCCAHAADALYDEETLAALLASGTRAGLLQGPADEHAGCLFRRPTGCAVDAAHRPNACVAYLCDELALELEERGALEAIRAQCDELARVAARYSSLRAMRQLAEALADVL